MKRARHISFREWSVAGVLGLFLIYLAFAAPTFYQAQPLLSLLAREAPALIVAAGMAMVIITRQIDISAGSQFAVCSVCGGLVAAAGGSVGWVLLTSIAVGSAAGMINGLLIAGLRLPSIVVTLATMVTWREGLRWMRQGQFVNLPPDLQWFGLKQGSGQWLIILFSFSVVILLAWMLKRIAAGRFLYAVGADNEAARLAGLRPQLVTFAVFVLLGLLIGAAATLNIVQSPQVDPKSGTGLELKVIAAVVVGGVAISGGRGNLGGVLAGFFLLISISPALTHLRIEAYWEKAIQGTIILLAVVADGWRSRRQITKRVLPILGKTGNPT